MPAETLRAVAEPATRLLERSTLLDELAALYERAENGHGALLFVGGEAGIGKTALVTTFAETRPPGARLLWGQCDAFSTPSPLGPLRDIAQQFVHQGIALPPLDAPRLELFSSLLVALREAPAIVVFEDVHWADEATLDLLRYLGRRVARSRALVIATWRDDEVGAAHPLRVALGDLASAGVRRLSIPALTAQAVRELAKRLRGDGAVDADSLHRATAGNAFYVTEVLAAGGAGIPPTVRDAVLARAARLDDAARLVLELAAVAGPQVEPHLLAALTSAPAAAIATCEASGILRRDGSAYMFRHELARQAILDSIAPPVRAQLHGTVLRALREAPAGTEPNLARLAHHAVLAGDAAAVLHFAVAAAREARSRGAHREAHAQFGSAIRHAAGLPPAARAALLDDFAIECQATGHFLEGIGARQQALELRRGLGDTAGEAYGLCRLSVLLINAGRSGEAETAVERALDLLAGSPPSHELAYAYRSRAFLYMLTRDNEAAIEWAHRAIDLAERIGDIDTVASAYNSLGSATIHMRYDEGCALLERSIEVARGIGSELLVFTAYVNLGSASGEVHRFVAAERYLSQGIAYANEHEIDASYSLAWRALCLLHLGRWDEAADVAGAVLAAARGRAISQNMALLALGRLRARRGDANAWDALDEALQLADSSGHLQRVAPVRAARAEAAWMLGDAPRCAQEARAAYDFATARRHGWFVGELGFWLHRCDAAVALPDYAAAPYAHQVRGDWRAAALAWQELGCPYERARALAEGDAGAQLQALAILDQLGARPAAEALRAAMRARGERSVPRGPRASTRANQFGLTVRELDILALLAEGLTNAQIATRHHRSVRTVDHQVAAILGKLGADSRSAAVARAREQRLLGTERRRQAATERRR